MAGDRAAATSQPPQPAIGMGFARKNAGGSTPPPGGSRILGFKVAHDGGRSRIARVAQHAGRGMDRHSVWALVLAAGSGTRLSHLTTTQTGTTIPKQFCSLTGGGSLVQEAVSRARAVAEPQRVCAIVAADHRHWWQPQLTDLRTENIIVQPDNRGTGTGVLLGLLRIAARDPNARILLLPSDHYVEDERRLARALRAVSRTVEGSRTGRLQLLGIEPEYPDTELGYVVPGAGNARDGYAVREFIEKPPYEEAHALVLEGALWNAFIIAAPAAALLDRYERRAPGVYSAMRRALQLDARRPGTARALSRLYRHLPPLDFSRHILAGEPHGLRVHRAPCCGWSDLGTPERVASTLLRVGVATRQALDATAASSGGSELILHDAWHRWHRAKGLSEVA
jgi:mannose-1-phosphate guanylyltransferase